MILKIKTKDGAGWKLIDKIRTINYEYIDAMEMNKRKAQNNRLKNTTWLINIFKSANIASTFAEIKVEFDDRIEVIYTDALVYILNDKGETCDSIHV